MLLLFTGKLRLRHFYRTNASVVLHHNTPIQNSKLRKMDKICPQENSPRLQLFTLIIVTIMQPDNYEKELS